MTERSESVSSRKAFARSGCKPEQPWKVCGNRKSTSWSKPDFKETPRSQKPSASGNRSGRLRSRKSAKTGACSTTTCEIASPRKRRTGCEQCNRRTMKSPARKAGSNASWRGSAPAGRQSGRKCWASKLHYFGRRSLRTTQNWLGYATRQDKRQTRRPARFKQTSRRSPSGEPVSGRWSAPSWLMKCATWRQQLPLFVRKRTARSRRRTRLTSRN
mmetsp:Transcript_6137/g.15213  ORF Transcript_6137/g.15213 Transcript_6137/m.15213 type:complete len:215 (-) Transcript_6137:2559-3203(-)